MLLASARRTAAASKRISLRLQQPSLVQTFVFTAEKVGAAHLTQTDAVKLSV